MEYEQECRIGGIPLRALPPGAPKHNGNINLLIDAFADEFNRVRPHMRLGCKTPEEAVRAEEHNRVAASQAAPKAAARNHKRPSQTAS